VNFVTTSHFAALAAALLLSSTAVSAQAESTTEPATQAAPVHAEKNSHDPNTVICKREEEIGSRLGGTKTCHTRADWDQMARDSAAAMENRQMAGAHAIAPMGH
jgi:cytochrome c5